jgi:hypothetical protein
MRRVEADTDWSLFSPADVPELVDLWGEEFDAAYRRAEEAGLAVKRLPARTLYARMMRTLAQTGNGWMTFKDAANRTANQTAEPGAVVHSSNPCPEILEVSADGGTAVRNLGSVNLGAFVDGRRDGLGTAGRHRPHRRHLPGPGRRHQLLPDRRSRALQRPLAPGRPRRDGPARRASHCTWRPITLRRRWTGGLFPPQTWDPASPKRTRARSPATGPVWHPRGLSGR